MAIKKYVSKKTGETTYKVEVVKKQFKQIVDRKYKTFGCYAAARSWEDLVKAYHKNMMWLTGDVTECSTLSEAAKYYQELSSSGLVKLGKTEYSNLNILADSPIAETMLCDLNTKSIINFAKWRRGASISNPRVSPQTTNSNLATLKMLLSSLYTLFDLKIDPEFMDDKHLLKALKREGLTQRSQARNRRPDIHELESIYNKLTQKQKSTRVKIPYTLMLLLTICTGLRISELVQLIAADIDHKGKFIWLRTYKGSGQQEYKRNWKKQPLVRGSYELLKKYLERENISSGKIFNFTSGGVTAAFRRALPELDIEDLRWHDLRREAISQIVELEVNKQIAMEVSRHKDGKTFDENYSHLEMNAIHDAIPVDLSAHPKMQFVEAELTA